MARHMLHNGLKKAASSGDISKMNMYFNGADSVPILDPKALTNFLSSRPKSRNYPRERHSLKKLTKVRLLVGQAT